MSKSGANKKKRCCTCKVVKSASDFHKDKSQPDGLNIRCKQCRSVFAKDNKPSKKIDNWCQVESVLQTMSELEVAIINEKAQCEKRLAAVQAYSDEATEPWQAKLMSLRALLESFIESNCKGQKTLKIDYRFGSIRILNGKLKIGLKTGELNRL